MKFSTFLLGGVAVLGLGSAAFAADLIIDEPVPATVLSSGTDWSGLYIGAHVGYGWGDWDYSGSFDGTPSFTRSGEPEGVLGGVQIGHNWQVDNVVLGLQADLDLAGIKVENPSGEYDSLDAFGTLSGRVGLALDSVLPYVKLGAGIGSATGTWAGGEEAQAGAYGWLAGAGLEVAVTDSISAFVEYNYIGFKTDTFEFTTANGRVDVEGSVQTIKTGLNFRF
jgi:opacity protein-like surface antigen